LGRSDIDRIKMIPMSTVGLTAAPKARGSTSKSKIDSSDVFIPFINFIRTNKWLI